MRARRLAHVQRAADVHVEVVLRALDRNGDARLRREVADHVRVEPLDRLPELLRVEDVDAPKLGGGGDVLLPTGREVVDHEQRGAVGEERVGYVRADEPGASGDHDTSRLPGHVRNTARRTGTPRMEEVTST